jgi:formylglycine-generating enzyme required for sulfatase activity
MTSERSVRGLACRWCAVVVLAMLGSLLSASVAQAQVQTFFVLIPGELQPDERAAYDECAERLSAALVNTDAWRATADIETQRTVQNCVGELASPAADRECKLSMANIEVDWILRISSRQIGEEWKWAMAALSPKEGGDQKWGGDEIPSGVTDRARSAHEACEILGQQFACALGAAHVCLGSEWGGAARLSGVSAAPTEPVLSHGVRSRVSALDVSEPSPPVVSVWIDGKDAGTSEHQVTGVPPGEHEVALKATGYFDHVVRLAFAAGVPTALKGVRLKKTTATLVVKMVEPAVATVLIAGRELGTTATPVAGIAPGEVEVTLRAEGYRERREPMIFESDRDALLEAVHLEALPATVTVIANILGAEVVVDGRMVGTTTDEADAFEVPSSSKLLEVRRKGYVTFVRRLSFRRGGTAEVRATLSQLQVASAAPGSDAPSVATGACPSGYVRIAPGTFTMGSPENERWRGDDETQHQVTITRAFCMKTTEVTQREWQEVMGYSPSGFTNCGRSCPVEQVSWDDSVRFANKLSQREELQSCYQGSRFIGVDCSGYRLPTEAEWEYAAIGSTKPDLKDSAWFGDNSGGRSQPVGRHWSNGYSLWDMLGNVREWTSDWYGDYGSDPVYDPVGPASGLARVYRGGSWSDPVWLVRRALRNAFAPDHHSPHIGFRLVRTAL